MDNNGAAKASSGQVMFVQIKSDKGFTWQVTYPPRTRPLSSMFLGASPRVSTAGREQSAESLPLFSFWCYHAIIIALKINALVCCYIQVSNLRTVY